MNQRTRGGYRRQAAAGFAVLLALGTAACGGDEKPDATGAAPAANAVTMRLIAFKPENLEAKAGTTVTWTQQDAGAHTVTSGTVAQGGADVTTTPDGRFESGQIATGDTFKFTFDTPGTYPYFCQIHPATMRGEIRIT